MDAASTLSRMDRERVLDASKDVVQGEKQCRISLAANAPHSVELSWHGGKGSRPTMIVLEPGKSVVQPLGRAQAWFGPFSLYAEYEATHDEKKRADLAQFISTETKRYLDRYDYVRGDGRGYHPDMRPTGPHRSPDVTVTILEADGSEHEPIRLYELYEIGEFDPLRDTFTPKASPEEVAASYERKLAERDAIIEEHRREMAELKGIVKGAVLGQERKGA